MKSVDPVVLKNTGIAYKGSVITFNYRMCWSCNNLLLLLLSGMLDGMRFLFDVSVAILLPYVFIVVHVNIFLF